MISVEQAFAKSLDELLQAKLRGLSYLKPPYFKPPVRVRLECIWSPNSFSELRIQFSPFLDED